MSWGCPIFGTEFEQRRLRVLNALVICLARCGMRPHASGNHGRELSVTVGDTAVPIRLDVIVATTDSSP